MRELYHMDKIWIMSGSEYVGYNSYVFFRASSELEARKLVLDMYQLLFNSKKRIEKVLAKLEWLMELQKVKDADHNRLQAAHYESISEDVEFIEDATDACFYASDIVSDLKPVSSFLSAAENAVISIDTESYFLALNLREDMTKVEALDTMWKSVSQQQLNVLSVMQSVSGD